MTKARLALATAALSVLLSAPAVAVPALADTGTSRSSAGSSADPLLTVCLTVTPKSLTVSANGVTLLALGPAGVPRTCIATPF
jgi:hypothetical protein